MKVIHMYTGDDERSHFREVEVDEEAMNIIGFTSSGWAVPTTEVRFNTIDDREMPPHNPFRRQFILVLSGTFEVECVEGAASVGAGAVLFAEDMTGEGHITRLSDSVSVASFGVPEDFRLAP
jgi:hypothetical protein